MADDFNFGVAKSITSDILGLSGAAKEQDAAARGQDITAQGGEAEANAYTTAGEIAKRNADLEGVAGRIQELQQQREALRTIHSGLAVTADAGRANTGSAMDIARSSLQQSYLGQQLIRTQTQINSGGFLEQGLASDAEVTAARTAVDASRNLADAQRQAASASAENAANSTEALQQYLALNPPQTDKEAAVQDLATSTVGGLSIKSPAKTDTNAIDDLSDPNSDQPADAVADAGFAGINGNPGAFPGTNGFSFRQPQNALPSKNTTPSRTPRVVLGA